MTIEQHKAAENVANVLQEAFDKKAFQNLPNLENKAIAALEEIRYTFHISADKKTCPN